MKFFLLVLISCSIIHLNTQTAEKLFLLSAHQNATEHQPSVFFEDINSRLSNKEKAKLKDHICQKHFSENYILATVIEGRSKASKNKDSVVIIQTRDASDNRCNINVNITLADIEYDKKVICLNKKFSYTQFVELMDEIQPSLECCCAIQ